MDLLKKLFNVKSEEGFAPIIAIIAIAIAAVAIPTTVILVQQEQDNRQEAQMGTTQALRCDWSTPTGCNRDDNCIWTIYYGKEYCTFGVKGGPACGTNASCPLGYACNEAAGNCDFVSCSNIPEVDTCNRAAGCFWTVHDGKGYCEIGVEGVSCGANVFCPLGYACNGAAVNCDFVSCSNIPEVDTCNRAAGCFWTNDNGCSPESGVVATPAPGTTITPEPPTNTPVPGGATPPPVTPTPTIPPEVGYCANASKGNASPGINGATCGINNTRWIDRTSTTGDDQDPYCTHVYSAQAAYFYECVTSTPTPTATPTPYTPQPIGGDCNPLQGTWQCQGGGYCSQACTSGSASSCTVGKCCSYGTSWNGTSCVADPTPTEPPVGTAPTAAPSPISTGDTCPDVNPGTNPPVFNVCRPSAPGCLTAEGETVKANHGANQACSDFYGGGTGYLCCQRAQATGAAGSSCNKTPVRTCDTSGNTSTGTNSQCTGCGGYCVPDSSGSSVGRCMNQYN